MTNSLSSLSHHLCCCRCCCYSHYYCYCKRSKAYIDYRPGRSAASRRQLSPTQLRHFESEAFLPSNLRTQILHSDSWLIINSILVRCLINLLPYWLGWVHEIARAISQRHNVFRAIWKLILLVASNFNPICHFATLPMSLWVLFQSLIQLFIWN